MFAATNEGARPSHLPFPSSSYVLFMADFARIHRPPDDAPSAATTVVSPPTTPKLAHDPLPASPHLLRASPAADAQPDAKAEPELSDQTNLLPLRQVAVVFMGLVGLYCASLQRAAPTTDVLGSPRATTMIDPFPTDSLVGCPLRELDGADYGYVLLRIARHPICLSLLYGTLHSLDRHGTSRAVSTALPTIGAEFGDSRQSGWVATAYLSVVLLVPLLYPCD